MNPINAVAYFYAGYGNSEVGMGWAAVYVRISEDRPGLQAGAQRQQEDCLRLAEQLGFTDLLVLVDNDVSAFDGGRRTGYDTLVAQIRGGVSRIVLWHVGRLYRRPRDFEGLLELVEQHAVRIDAVRGGEFDLKSTEGRLVARQLVASAAYKSGHKSDRIKRANRPLAEQGAWHGAARYGYGPAASSCPTRLR